MGRKKVYRDISCPECNSHHVAKVGKVRGKQEYKCMDCGRKFLEDAKHRYRKEVKELALKMYVNGMSTRAIARVLNVPRGTVFTWIKRYGKDKQLMK